MHLRKLIWLILFCIASPAMAGFSAGGGWLFLHFKRGANAAAISRLETLKRDFVKDYGNQAPTIVTPEVVRRRKEIYDLAFKVAEPDFAMAAQVDGYGRVLVGGGRISEAQPIFKKALDMRLHAAGAEPVWRLRAYQAFASAKLRGKGHEAEARRAAERAVRYWREHPRAGWEQMGSSEKDLYAVFDTDGIFGTYASSLWADVSKSGKMTLSDKRHAFEAVQREIENRAEAVALARLVARRVAAGKGGDLVDLLDERDAAFVERREAEKKFMHAAGAVGADTEHGASATLSALRMRENNADARLDRRIRTLTRKIDDRWPGYRAAAFPPPLSVEEAQRLLSLDEAVIVVAPSTTGTQVVAISQDRIEWREAPDNIFALFETVRRLRWFAGAPVEASDREEAEWSATVDGGIDGFDRATAYHVYKQLFAPFESIFKNKRVLYVAAGGPLDTLPLSILVTAPPEGRDNDPAALRQTHWFGDEVAIASVPSLQSLQSIRQRPASDAQVQFAGFGDPVLAGRSEVRGGLSKHLRPTPAVGDGEQDLSVRGSASLATLRSLASLPGTAMEIRTVAETFKPQGSVFLGADATERFVRSTDLSRFRIIDFATHGLLAGELAVDSETGLVLTPPAQPSVSDDGFLTASEISGLTLDADWVILSACNTAGGDDSRSTGSSGLARAFLIAGARSLLLSHWPVRDDVAPLLILHTIQHRAQGSSRAEALQLAMRDVRNNVSHDKIDASGLNETWSHPNAWAPFALVGEGH